MSRTIVRVLLGLLGFILLIVIGFAIFGFFTVRRSFPKVDGEIQLSDLDGRVDVYRDQYGIPHIYAASLHDLFFAEGYIHAQDRFWQMDFWRHIGSARLSEMFGESQLETDQFLRTLGWARVVENELDALDADSFAILQAYADGVNAYLVDHQGSSLSLEYAVLKLTTAAYEPEPWEPLHSLTWAKAMAWDLGGNMNGEIEMAALLKDLTVEQVSELVPPYPEDHPFIVPGFEGSFNKTGTFTGINHSPMAGSEAPGLEIALERIRSRSAVLDDVLGPRGAGIGSNSWVISGELTSTGMPLLANDPHLGIMMPSIWYEVGLHCTPKDTLCPFDVTGYSFAGTPGVIIGHNDKIAWGFTNVGPDVQDLYIEKINPQNPDQYEVNGQWVDMEIVQEVIQVAGGEPVPLTVRYTRHGPIISETYASLDRLTGSSAVELPENYAVALRWTALEESNTFPALWKINLAQNWDEFRAATEQFDVPSQNLVYADVDGNIGYQTPGRIPIRANGDGMLPVPGWTDEYEWSGYIPFEELPNSFNPPEGYITTANNAVVEPGYPYMISMVWAYGYRAERIVEMIQSVGGPIDIPYIQHMQGDNANLNAETILPVLMQIPLNDERLEQARGLFDGWDGQQPMDSAPAALFNAFWKHLLAETFWDELPEAYRPDGNARWFEVMRIIVPQQNSAWWDNRTTPGVENRDQIFSLAFAEAVDEMEQSLGKDPQHWNWGDQHFAIFRNQSLGKSGIAPIESLFNRGPYRTAGGESIVNATGWSADAVEDSYEVDWLPSHRMIVDLGNLQNSLSIHTTGQSGHAYNRHYVDMADLWRNIQYHPMNWERGAIEADAEGHLILVP
jgi:penicillin amidase